jgi:3-oxoacyl-[acyl-carrier protein] reductase
MAISLKGKNVLVTGSTDGLGKHIILELIKQGSNVIVHGRSEEKVNNVIKEIQSTHSSITLQSIVCDLNKPQEIEKQFSQIDQLDTLINNAGVWLEGDTIDATSQKIIELTNSNLLAPLLVTRTLLSKLLEAEFSQILNVSSIAGVEIPAGYYHTIYSAVKFGLQGFNEALAKEFYDKNLRIMGYYPSGMETNFFKKAGVDYKDKEPWMFHPQESVEAIIFMLTRDKKVNIKRMDLINQLEI